MQHLNVDPFETPFVEEVYFQKVIEVLVKLTKQSQLRRNGTCEKN